MSRLVNWLNGGIFTLACLVMISCVKDETDEIETKGKASAMVNGKLWIGEVNVFNRGDKMNIIIDHFKEIDGVIVPWEGIGILMVHKKEDSIQRIFKSDSLLATAPWLVTHVSGSFSTSQELGHVACDYYEIIEQDSINNWVRIDKQQDNFSEVWGSFEMHVYRTDSCKISEYPDTLMITDGKFHFSL